MTDWSSAAATGSTFGALRKKLLVLQPESSFHSFGFHSYWAKYCYLSDI